MSETTPHKIPTSELIKRARQHYDEISQAASHWNSVIPEALDALEREQTEIESLRARLKEVEGERADLQRQINNYLTFSQGGAGFSESQLLDELSRAEGERGRLRKLILSHMRSRSSEMNGTSNWWLGGHLEGRFTTPEEALDAALEATRREGEG